LASVIAIEINGKSALGPWVFPAYRILLCRATPLQLRTIYILLATRLIMYANIMHSVAALVPCAKLC